MNCDFAKALADGRAVSFVIAVMVDVEIMTSDVFFAAILATRVAYGKPLNYCLVNQLRICNLHNP